ncbi:MAG: hypothetical protein RRZ84_08965 [Romboutsia sp.]
MKKSLIGTLALGLIIGAGALTVKSFADENQVTSKVFNSSINQIESTTNESNSTGFKVLNQETSQFEQLDDSDYRNSNPNYGQSCPHMGYGKVGNENIN